MDNRTYLLFGILIAAAYLLGREHSPVKIVTKTETIYVDKIVEVESKVENQIVIEKIKVKANGDSLTVRKIKSQTQSELKKDQTFIAQSKSDQIIHSRTDKTTILLNLDLNRTLGVSVSRPMLGPMTIGVFGFLDGRAGASVGLQF